MSDLPELPDEDREVWDIRTPAGQQLMGVVTHTPLGYRAYDQTEAFINRFDNYEDAKAAVEAAYSPPPPTTGATLLIDPSWTYCGGCGQMADPHQDAHITVPPGMSRHEPEAGCYLTFVALSSHYRGERIAAAARALRPDLPWIEPPE